MSFFKRRGIIVKQAGNNSCWETTERSKEPRCPLGPAVSRTGWEPPPLSGLGGALCSGECEAVVGTGRAGCSEKSFEDGGAFANDSETLQGAEWKDL